MRKLPALPLASEPISPAGVTFSEGSPTDPDFDRQRLFHLSHSSTAYLGAAQNGSPDSSDEEFPGLSSLTLKGLLGVTAALISLSLILTGLFGDSDSPAFTRTTGPISISVEKDGHYRITADSDVCTPSLIAPEGAVITCLSGGTPNQPEPQAEIPESEPSGSIDERSI